MPTIKQKQVFEKVVKGSTISGAMKEVGYASSTSKRTNKITKSDGWLELLKKHIPDSKLAKVLDDGLEAFRISSSLTEPDRVVPDFAVRHKYLETGLKLKNKFPKELNESALDGDIKVLLVQINNVINPQSRQTPSDIQVQ